MKQVAFNPTIEQQNAIDAVGTVLVSAAAGSGKTAVLVERVISRLTDEKAPIDADRLLIVTFTNAAAAEMRSRIEIRFNEELEKQPSNPRLIRQQLLISRASICTIDSFCINLIREYFHTLGIRHDFKVADPSSLLPLKKQAMDQILSNHYEAGDNDFFKLLNALGADYGDSNLIDMIIKIYDSSRALPFPEQWLDSAADLYNLEDDLSDTVWIKWAYEYAENEIDNCINSLFNIIKKIEGVEKIEKAYLPSLNDGYNQLTQIKQSVCNRDWDGVYCGINGFNFSRLSPLRNFEDIYLIEETKSVRDNIKKKIKDLSGLFFADCKSQYCLIKQAAPHIKMLIKLVKEFDLELKELCAKMNILSFDAIEQKALSLLTNNYDKDTESSDITQTITQKYDEILVDEYQDTNTLQDTLFFALSDNGKKLFMVGDVKQSIYGFRYANPDNFMERKNTYTLYNGVEYPAKIILKNNFRSRKGVCDFVNFFFSKMMTNSTCGMDYTKEEELSPLSEFPENGQSDVELHLLNYCTQEDKREELEAEFIAAYIKDIMSKGKILKDKNNPGELRKVNFGDIAVLLRSPKDRSLIYLNELRRHNIPVWSNIGGFLSTTEIMTMMSLLKAVNNPTRDIDLIAAMMSPIYGFTPDEMAQIRLKNRKSSFISAVTIAAQNGDERCIDLLDSLRKFRDLAVTLPVSMLIQRIYDVTGFTELMLAMDDGERRKSNLLQLINYALSFENGDVKSLTGFIRMMEKMQNSAGLKSASVASSTDAVKILSIHSSKGLQFPICILASSTSKFNKTDSYDKIIINEKYGIGMKIIDENKHRRYTTIAREMCSLLSKRQTLSEELRLIYVAMTRAEEKLIIPIAEKRLDKKIQKLSMLLSSNSVDDYIDSPTVLSATGYADWILMSALLHPSGQVLRDFAESDITAKNAEGKIEVKIHDEPVFIPEFTPDKTENITESKELLDEIENRLKYRYPYENLNKISSKTSVSKLVHEADRNDYSFTSRPNFISDEGLSPAEKGTATHKFMQFADYEKASINAKEELERLAEWEYISDAEAEAIDISQIERFFQSNLFNRIKNSKNVMRELRFLTEMSAGEIDSTLAKDVSKESILVQGIVDCVFEEDGKLVVLDFKTDRVKDPEKLVSTYAPQLEIYAKSLGKAYKKQVKEGILYSFNLSEEISVFLM